MWSVERARLSPAPAPAPLGALLVRTRKRAGLTQEALAERAGVSVNTISNLEAGRGHLPRLATLDLLAEALAGALPPGAAERAGLRAALRQAAGVSRAPTPELHPAAEADGVVPSQEAPPLPPPPSGRLTFLVCAPVRPPAARPGHASAQAALLRRWAARLGPVVSRHGGRLVDPLEGPESDESDGVVGVFPHAGAAVAAACALQLALWERPTGLRSRPGEDAEDAEDADMAAALCLALHTGWAEPGTGAYAGPTRRRAARLARLGQAGQLLLTEATRELVGHSLPAGVRLHEAGQRSLSAVERPQPIYQLLPPATTTLPLPPADASPAPPTNLPVQLSSFVGREREQAAVGALLAQAPLVTLVGAGGCGKTRLALAVAAALLEDYPDGVWLVELAALADPALAPQAVAAALGLREEAGHGQPLLAALSAHLRAKRLLLLLDNCEHLLAACAELASTLLRASPTVRILATSREALRVSGEHVYRVPSLGVPAPQHSPSLECLGAYPAVHLFVTRAQERREFALTDQTAPVVAEICKRLDGLPLPIELAAARVGSLPLETLAARLEQSLGMLTEGPRDAPPRQRTLRATLDWSWALLGEPERAVLRRLAVFRGGWAVEAAEAVCGGPDDLAGWPLLGLLGGLVSKSLVGLQESAGAGRFGLLETVRQYAAERLAAAGEEVTIRDRHLDWCLGLAEAAALRLTGPEQGVWLGRLEVEHDNLRAALRWAREHADGDRGLRLAAALWRFWLMRGYLSEGRGWLEAALAGAQGVSTARATALDGAGVLAFQQGDYARAAVLHEEALALRRALGDRPGIAASLNNLGNVASEQGNYERAVALYEESLLLQRALGNTRGIANALACLGIVADLQGDYGRAVALYEESMALQRALGDIQGIARSLSNLGIVAKKQGDYARAVALYEESLALQRDLGDRWGIANVLHNLGVVADLQGDDGRAAAVLEESLALQRALGDTPGVALSLGSLGDVAYIQGEYGRAVALYEESLALQRALGDRWGIARALANLSTVAYMQADLMRAATLLDEAFLLSRDIGAKDLVADVLEGLAWVSAARGRPRRATWLGGAAGAQREALGVPLPRDKQAGHGQAVQAMRAAMGEEAFAAAWAEGQALSLEQAIALALDEDKERVE